MTVFANQEAQKSSAEEGKSLNKGGDQDIGVGVKKVKSPSPAKVAAAKIRDVKIAVNTDSEDEIDWTAKRAKNAVVTCMLLCLAETLFMLYVGARFGYDTINSAFFWSEVALVLVTLALSYLASAGVQSRSSGALVPFLMLFLPRVTAPITFYAMSRPETIHRSYTDYVFNSVYLAFISLACVCIWFDVHRFYRELIQAEAVNDFVKRKRQTDR